MALYAQTSGKELTVNSSSWTPIASLTVTLPGGVGATAILILNAGLPYATGNNFPGGNFGVSVNGAVSPVFAGFTYSEQQPAAYGRFPTTVVVGVPLTEKPQAVQAVWQNVRGSTVIIDTPATLTAIID